MRFDVGCQLSRSTRQVAGLVGLRFDADIQRPSQMFPGGTKDKKNNKGKGYGRRTTTGVRRLGRHGRWHRRLDVCLGVVGRGSACGVDRNSRSQRSGAC